VSREVPSIQNSFGMKEDKLQRSKTHVPSEGMGLTSTPFIVGNRTLVVKQVLILSTSLKSANCLAY
jgi:hypothetical protein